MKIKRPNNPIISWQKMLNYILTMIKVMMKMIGIRLLMDNVIQCKQTISIQNILIEENRKKKNTR